MNDHTLRLKLRVFEVIKQYEKGLIYENELENFIRSTANAIEDKALEKKMLDFCTAINDSLYQLNEEEGKAYLSKKIYDFNLLF